MSHNDPLVVACVLDWKEGCDFDVEYVRKLCIGVERHLSVPHRFVCLSNVDVPCERIPLMGLWRGWWAKMELFRPDVKADRILYFDLDTVIVGDLGEIASIDRFTMTDDFLGAGKGAGVMMLKDRAPIWERFMSDGPKAVMRSHRSDQEYIETMCGAIFDDIVPGQIVSYKRDVRRQGRIPADARVVSFHGRPRPHDLAADDWMREHWA